MLKTSDFYIDLGTANTLVAERGRGLLLNECTAVAVKKSGPKSVSYLASGADAKIMLGRTPLTSQVLRPLNEGVISDFDTTVRMLHSFMKQVKETFSWIKPRIVISLPYQVTQHEREAVENVGKELGARIVNLIDEPVMAAIGSGLDVTESKGQMIVDIGAGTSEASILSLGGTVTSKAVRIGGNFIDLAIMNHLKNRHHFLIGEQTAEILKIRVGQSDLSGENLSTEIGGIDLIQGLPRRMTITSEMISPPIETFSKEVVRMVKKAFEECPPELAGDIAESGLLLSGGGSLLRGLPKTLMRELGTSVTLSDDPLLAVAHGGIKVIQNNKLFDRLQAS